MSPGFEAIMMKAVFNGRTFDHRKEFAQFVASTGLALGACRVYGTDAHCHLFGTEGWAKLHKKLGIHEYSSVEPFSSQMVVIDVLKEDRMVKHFFSSET